MRPLDELDGKVYVDVKSDKQVHFMFEDAETLVIDICKPAFIHDHKACKDLKTFRIKL